MITINKDKISELIPRLSQLNLD